MLSRRSCPHPGHRHDEADLTSQVDKVTSWQQRPLWPLPEYLLRTRIYLGTNFQSQKEKHKSKRLKVASAARRPALQELTFYKHCKRLILQEFLSFHFSMHCKRPALQEFAVSHFSKHCKRLTLEEFAVFHFTFCQYCTASENHCTCHGLQILYL